ncbi:putative calcium-transporting ATPase 13, plasma membrane-type [Sesamum angolense]|uniref:Calcium-transporting ATPase 13, plasma membrane-type n=1 Tax=Sesamum angolense TaxID=2727404 RepID=A0AAE2C1Y5_9LAMI|nr:putative calcium-transporting ATPase 13, plasma membrane-type [Sesamum angolense]
MSAIVLGNLSCMELLSDLHDSMIKVSVQNKKRWQLAFATIYCSRAFLSRFKSSSRLTASSLDQISGNRRKISPDTSSRNVIDVVQEHPLFSGVDQSSLTKLVKEKRVDRLAELGGVEGVASSLHTDQQCGIKAFKDPTILILLVCAALSLGFGIKEHGPKEGWYDGGSIFVAVFLVISVSAVSNFRQNRQFDKLSKVSNNIPVEAARNGRRQQISIFEIVVGDVVCLKIGDQVPADGLFIDGHSLQVDESSMTGESDHVEIDLDKKPFLFSSTKVADGYAKMLVTSVGMSTTWGEMMSTISRDSDEQTPLQARLNKLTSSIGKVGLAVAFVVLVVLLVRYFTGNTKDENGNKEFNGSKTKVDDVINAVVGIIAAAVTIVVVAIPEGLPLAVTLTLAYSMKRMMADHAMVRKLSACETMGSAITICTDKTGTLALNQMKVTMFWQGKESMEGGNHSVIASNVLELLHQGVGLNTTGSVYKSGVSGVEFSGSPTEKAILSWAVLELNIDMEAVKRDCEILHVEAFNSEKKRSGVLIKKVEDGTFHVHWKGAAEMILAMCSHYYDMEGNMKALSDCERTKFDQILQGEGVNTFEIVVGDVVCLKIGDQVPADGLFIEGHSLQVDESSMTGESDHVEVSKDQHPFVLSGTKVADEYAKMLVTSVGMSTTWGEMMSTISCSPDEQTPLQARLNKLTSSIGKVGLAVAFLVLVVLLVRYFTGNTGDGNGNKEFNGNKTRVDDVINAVVGIIAAAVTIVVVAIPEGLPLAVTLTLAYSMKRMMADQAMAILSWAALELNMDIDKQDFTVLSVEAFNSEKKRSGVFLKNVKEGTVHAHWKGAAEMILAMCSHYYMLKEISQA